MPSDNRKDNTNYNTYDLLINETIMNKKLLRGEKEWKHMRNHTLINIPILNYNLSIGQSISEVFVLYAILINIKYPSNKNKFLLILSILLKIDNKLIKL